MPWWTLFYSIQDMSSNWEQMNFNLEFRTDKRSTQCTKMTSLWSTCFMHSVRFLSKNYMVMVNLFWAQCQILIICIVIIFGTAYLFTLFCTRWTQCTEQINDLFLVSSFMHSVRFWSKLSLWVSKLKLFYQINTENKNYMSVVDLIHAQCGTLIKIFSIGIKMKQLTFFHCVVPWII